MKHTAKCPCGRPVYASGRCQPCYNVWYYRRHEYEQALVRVPVSGWGVRL